MVMAQKPINLAGPVKVLSEGEYPTKYAGVYMRPEESRKMFEERGWSEVAALQLRNPMHRSHEYLCKIAVEVPGCDSSKIVYNFPLRIKVKLAGLTPCLLPQFEDASSASAALPPTADPSLAKAE